mmetsp:Transcript_5172/g.17608  ORF Transcript_5172/g.17608 Transcript_5172/m.17608 type:complete len:87 (+) Transcript_5172:407-667(+)
MSTVLLRQVLGAYGTRQRSSGVSVHPAGGYDSRDLDEICDIHGHFINLSRIVLLNIPEDPHVVIFYEVNCNTLAAKSSGAPNAMYI